MTESDWQACLGRMDEHERCLRAWEPEEPNPAATHCAQSRHRTLAHLRACQDTWLAACRAFAERQNPRVTLLHPWRLFERDSYELIPWEQHLAVYLADRARWRELLASTDRTRAGKLNGRECSIASLTEKLVAHEHHHLFRQPALPAGPTRHGDH